MQTMLIDLDFFFHGISIQVIAVTLHRHSPEWISLISVS